MDEKLGEHELLERVFMRLGAASTDEQLQEFTKKFLTPVLLKLASPKEDVKKKVLELLAQINRLLKNRECVQLPVDGLFLQYQDPKCTQYVRNFTILYLKMGFTRLSSDEQLAYLPQLLSSIAGKPHPQQICLLQLAIPVFALFIVGDNLSVMKDVHSVVSKDKTTLDLFLGFALDVLIMPYNAVTNIAMDENKLVPPGLSKTALHQVLSAGVTSENLENVKLGVLKFLSADVFDIAAVQVHLVVSMGDSHHTISDYAGHQIKRMTEPSDWEHVNVMNKLMSIFLGNVNIPGKSAPPPDECRAAAGIALQLKIFPFLLKSRKCSNIFPGCLQIVFHVDQSESGNQAKKKLKKFRIQFIHHLCEFSSDKVIKIISPILLSSLLKLIAGDDESDIERITFLAIGKIAKRSPALFHGDTTVIQSLFQALRSKDPDTGLDILQTLSMITNACKSAPPAILTMIEALVLDNVDQEKPQCRLAALQTANILFPTDHVKSRYACLLASADSSNDIREEASRGLLFQQHKKNDGDDGPSLPDFGQLINFIHQTLNGGSGYKQSYITVAGTLPFSPAVLINMLHYLHLCLNASAGVTQEDIDNDLSLIPLSEYVQNILKEQDTVLYHYLAFIQESLKPAGSYNLHAAALGNLLEVLASATKQLALELNQDAMSRIKSFLWSSHSVIRNTSAQIFALLICQSGTENVLQELTSLLRTVNDPSEAVCHGTINCIGHLVGQYLCCQNVENSMNVVDLDDSEFFESKIEKAIADTFRAIISFLASHSSSLVHTACDAVGEVCKQSSMPLPDGTLSKDNNTSYERSLSPEEIATKADIIRQLAHLMKNSREAKLCEKATLVLGMTCVGEQQFPHTKQVIEILFDASKKRDVDFQFTVGEALSCAGAGKLSTASRSKWVVNSSLIEEIPETKETMKWMLGRIVQEYFTSDVAHVRKAACIWLLVLLKHSSKHPAVQEMMTAIQQAFSSMLSENDEIVQEVSSKGLSLVYEFGSEEFRKNIVSSLIDTMLFSKKKVQNVTADTKLFDKAMPIGDAGQLSTYKELCSLASDMNQPELVYRFLHLANHNALWNSKKGAAFGFASIASQAKKELQPHLKTLVPRLYRYQFDPNSKVREAMLSIWHAIVKDQRKVIDEFKDDIVAELLANLHNPTWRIRQSCCVAVGNFLNGRSLDSVLEYLPQLWTMCLRDMDDIKESVRNAAEVACKTLQSVSIRVCDPDQGKLGQEAVRILLPVLLEQGLASRVDDIRKLVLHTIVKISKNAGGLLKPHIPILVASLLESLSTLEPQQLNYLSLQLQKDPNMQERLEDARISFSKSSPMMETVSLCVQHVDETVLERLVPHLAELLRSGLGLGTKAGCASFVISLEQQCGQKLQPHAGKLLSALLSGLTDKSRAIRKKYAEAIGSLVKVSKDSSVSKLFGKMKSWYFEKENESVQEACGLVCKEISRSSPDVLAHHAASILPVAFVAMHRKDKVGENKSPWADIWSENTPVSKRGIQLYLQEIVHISSMLLASQSWERKVEAANSIQTVVTTLQEDIPTKFLDSIVTSLLSSLSGRTWDGKESIICCVATVFVKCHTMMDADTTNAIAGAVLKECRKQKPVYKAHAIKCLSRMLEEKKVIAFKEVYDVVQPIVSPVIKKPDDGEEKDDEEQMPDANLVINAFECIGSAWPSERELQIEQREMILNILTSSLRSHPWKIQLAILESLNRFVGKVTVDKDAEFQAKIVSEVLPELFPCLENVRYAAIRLKSLEVSRSLLSLVEKSKLEISSCHRDLLRELYRLSAILRNDNNENVKIKSIELDGLLKKFI